MAEFQKEDFLSTETKKDCVLHYLNESGVKARLNEIFMKMLNAKEKPENPIDFIRMELGDDLVSDEEIRKKEDELDSAEREIRRLGHILSRLEHAKQSKADAKKN